MYLCAELRRCRCCPLAVTDVTRDRRQSRDLPICETDWRNRYRDGDLLRMARDARSLDCECLSLQCARNEIYRLLLGMRHVDFRHMPPDHFMRRKSIEALSRRIPTAYQAVG